MQSSSTRHYLSELFHQSGLLDNCNESLQHRVENNCMFDFRQEDYSIPNIDFGICNQSAYKIGDISTEFANIDSSLFGFQFNSKDLTEHKTYDNGNKSYNINQSTNDETRTASNPVSLISIPLLVLSDINNDIEHFSTNAVANESIQQSILDLDSNIEMFDLLKRHGQVLDYLLDSLKVYSIGITKLNIDNHLLSTLAQSAKQKTNSPNYLNSLIVQHLQSEKFKHSNELINLVNMNIENECKASDNIPLATIERIEPNYNINSYSNSQSYNDIENDNSLQLKETTSEEFGSENNNVSICSSLNGGETCLVNNFDYDKTIDLMKDETTSMTDYAYKIDIDEHSEVYSFNNEFLKEMMIIKNLLTKIVELTESIECFEEMMTPFISASDAFHKKYEDNKFPKVATHELNHQSQNCIPAQCDMLLKKKRKGNKYNVLSHEDRHRCVNFANQTDPRTAAEEFNIPERNIKRWIKEGYYREMICSDIESNLISEIRNHLNDNPFSNQRKEKINYMWIKNKAADLMKLSKYNSFSSNISFIVSVDWIRKTLRKYNIKLNPNKA